MNCQYRRAIVNELGEVVTYGNTVTKEEIKERIKDADIVILNKSQMNEETLKDAESKAHRRRRG